MICSRCKKNPAIVFVSSNKDGNDTKGYCLKCAKELNIKQVSDIIDKMGITEEDLEAAYDQMRMLTEDGSLDMNELMDMSGIDDDLDDDDDQEKFERGGAPVFPFMKGLFNTGEGANNTGGADKTFSGVKGKDKKKEKKRKMLGAYCTNLTAKAKNGELDRIIGRDKETGRVVQILSRRIKNNPCLIGEPGVGKTAIAEGLAIRIVNGDVPQRLKNKEIFLLDLTALVAGTQFRGQFEKRIKDLIDEVKADGNIILFIDEVHNLVGAGESEGSMNAANILKPALSRGEIQVIGATTFSEYRKYIEKDTALERRFQPVTVNEPSIADTIAVIGGIKDYYENFHSVKVSDKIVRKTVILSERYITDRFLPDKAIDLLDEACTHASLRNKDRDRYESLTDKKIELEEKEKELSEEETIDYEKLAQLRSEAAKIDKEIDSIDINLLHSDVTEDDIAGVIELWTGIPATRVKENELKKLSGLEDNIKAKIIGQDEAVEALCAAIRRSRVQISPKKRPSSFIFVGPTGVGKTELVKVLSQELFDSPETLIRLDMSEYMEKHSVSKIIGSPPGYVGYEEAGHVTEKVRRRPYSVLLFDEIEKAHPDVLNILLQILDEGKITDAHGRVVNFENTVIVMTSNAGSERKENLLGFGKTEFAATKEKALKALSDFLRPEFIARLDEIIVFRNLNSSDIEKIAELMLDEYKTPLADKGIVFDYDKSAAELIAKKSDCTKNGAREVRNTIRKLIEDKIAKVIIDSDEASVGGIFARAENDEIFLDIK
ncbi:MAG: ATP-dependent Clp protease ATP-binding subunit [Clostridiales bacterium]|nr:ATP-dependent Clp protease ATP-binding subunit [Clostridiales bacterium]